MSNRTSRPGYIVVMTTLIIAAATVIVSVIFTSGSVFIPYADTAIKREQAKMLALGGLSVARAQLAQVPHEADRRENKKESEQEVEAKLLLRMVLPFLNRWQTFALTGQADGIDGQMAICLTAEDGKIDLNKMRDKNGAIDKSWQPLLEGLVFKTLGKEVKTEGLLESLNNYFKEHKEPLHDVTELLRIPNFSAFRDSIVYEPPAREKESAAQKKRPFYLTDIFTVHGSDMLDPWLLSDSLVGLLGLGRATSGDQKDRKRLVDTVVKEAKTTANWATDWDKYLKPLYGKELQSLPKNIESILNKQFSPKIFSVISEGTVGKVTQRLFALIQRERRAGDNGQRYYDVTIKKLYWL